MRDDADVWLLGQGGAALGCCVALRREEHVADNPLQIGRARGCALLLNDQEVSGTHAALWWEADGVPAWSSSPLGSAPARLLRLLRVRLAALGSPTLLR